MNNCLCSSHNPRLYINKKLFAIRRKIPACQTTFPVKKTYQEGKHPKNLNPGKDSFSRQKTRLPLASTLRNISPVFIFPIKYRLYFTGRFSATPSSRNMPLLPGFELNKRVTQSFALQPEYQGLVYHSFYVYNSFMILLTAFLGNYGTKYAGTRHNSAWIFSESIDFLDSLNWQKKFKGQYAAADKAALLKTGEDFTRLHFIKPETYMNLSGESVSQVAAFYKIEPSQILVVHDELELPLGTVSLKWGGGLGGHNGLRSMRDCFGTNDFWRLRIGIGRPSSGDIAEYVLSPFSSDERIILSQIFPKLQELYFKILLKDPEPYLKDWSKKNLLS